MCKNVFDPFNVYLHGSAQFVFLKLPGEENTRAEAAARPAEGHLLCAEDKSCVQPAGQK